MDETTRLESLKLGFDFIQFGVNLQDYAIDISL